MRIRLFAPGLLTFTLALFASGVLTRQVPEGLPVTPQLTLLLVPTARLLMFAFGALAFGGALIGGLLGGGNRPLRIAALSAAAYALTSAVVAILTLADVLARDWWWAFDPSLMRSFLTQVDEGRYLATQVILGALAAWVLSRARQPLDSVFATVALGTAVVLPGFTGHSAAAVSHWMASTVMVFHLLAISAWVGGVVVLALAPLPASIVAFGRIAGVALPVVLMSGVASVVARINDWASLPHDRYALVLLLKIAVTCAVIWFGARVRHRAADTLAGSDTAPAVRRVLAFEGSLMFVVLGLAVVLARMPNP
jgi:putative copper resistance protein D